MQKRFFSLFLCFVVAFTVFILLPTEISAATEGKYTYSVSNHEATIIDVDTSISGNVTIPSTLGGYPVTTISALAFSDCSYMTGVIIPDCVTSIGEGAFSGCSGLESMTIPFVGKSRETDPNTNQILFGYIFGTSSYTGGTSVKQQYYSHPSNYYYTSYTSYIPTNLKSVTVAGGKILYGAFYNCSNLTSITLGNHVTSIGRGAFRGCTGLTSITIPDSVTSIGNSAFDSCTNLKSIFIGKGVRAIGHYFLSNTSSLKRIVFLGNIPSFIEEVDPEISDTLPEDFWCDLKCLNCAYFQNKCLRELEATIYYPANDNTWDAHAAHNFSCCDVCPNRALVWESCDHSSVVIDPAVPVTCYSEGLTEGSHCGRCGVVFIAQQSIPKKHIYEAKIIEPGCETDGYTLHTCVLCGFNMKDNFVDPTGHTRGEWEVVKEATQTVTGLKQLCCTACGAVLEEEILPMLNAPVVYVIAKTDPVIVGQPFEIYITVQNCSPVKAAAFVPGYDSDIFEFVSAEWLRSAEIQTVESKMMSAWNTATDINGDLIKLVFKANDLTAGSKITTQALVQDENNVIPLFVVGDTVAVIECSHAEFNITSADDTYHSCVCKVCGYTELNQHSFDHSCDTTCNDCQYTRVIIHTPSAIWELDESQHWKNCTVCGDTVEIHSHVYDGYEDCICNDCGYCRVLRGDVNGDGRVNSDDAIFLLSYTFFPADYPINQNGDMNGDGSVNSDDTIYLLSYTFFPTEYPLYALEG